ncbi:GTPase domain-containing protein [Aeromicrobium yanjiei]|uniref:G domain-containing protein n=1 Tax=Aeromicrobium yanjiei TaxID=2662028 RepID=A0A5Q2MGS0_9ACTN|nr:GTPase domain-containing protein [Aeromicrobium yanjiei]QGG41848.1 hypothetical protein GEV26_10995 [Aeromicrobium yanjiei]
MQLPSYDIYEVGRLNMFGLEPTSDSRPTPDLTGAIAATGALISEQYRSAAGALDCYDDATAGASAHIVKDVGGALHALPKLIEDATSRASTRGESPFRVVMMGRTTAGKSTLLEFLSHGDGNRIGDGRQRYSRDVCARLLPELPGVTLVDVPGVGAADGQVDFDIAFGVIPESDLVMWVGASDSPQEETTRALRILGAHGKPVVLVLNCREDLHHRAKRADFLEGTGRTFADANDHLDLLTRELASAGGRPVAAVAIHARAAFESLQDTRESEALRRQSRIQSLIELLLVQQIKTSAQRRIFSRVDALRMPALEAQGILASCAASLAARQSEYVELARDLDRRMIKALEQKGDSMVADAKDIARRRRSWHLSVDPRSKVERVWENERDTMVDELQALMDEWATEMAELLDAVREQTVRDHDALPAPDLSIGDLPGFGSAYANHLARLGVGLGEALAGGAIFTAAVTAGAQGAIIGAPGGPLGIVAGALVGTLASVALAFAIQPLKDSIDKVFRGSDYVLNKRRDQLRRSLGGALDKAEAVFEARAAALVAQFKSALATLTSDHALQQQSLQSVSDLWSACGARVNDSIGDLDTATAKAVLHECGRVRNSEQVRAAARAPGFGIAIEMTEVGYAELALYPPRNSIEAIAATPPRLPAFPAGVAGHALAALEPRARLVKLNAHEASYAVSAGTSVARGLLDLLEELCGRFTRSSVSIVQLTDSSEGTA